jgi:hypothetical protein
MSNSRVAKVATSDESRAVVANLGKKLAQRGVRVASLVSRCEEADRNNDNLIHENDLYKILMELLGRGAFSQREMHHVSNVLESRYTDGQVDYRRLYEVFNTDGDEGGAGGSRENWHDENGAAGRGGRGNALGKGSVGEWLQTAACPAEVKNFKRFIACMEEYERISGMKCINTEDGFTVPLGPDLKTSVKFYMS